MNLYENIYMIHSYIVHHISSIQGASDSMAICMLHYIAILHVIYIAPPVTSPLLVS